MSSTSTSAPKRNPEDENERRHGHLPTWINFRNAILILALTFQILSFLKHGRVVFLGSEGGSVSSIGSVSGAPGRGAGQGAVDAASGSAGTESTGFIQATAFSGSPAQRGTRGLAAIRSASATGSGPGGSSRDPSAEPVATPLGSSGASAPPASQAAETRKAESPQAAPSGGGDTGGEDTNRPGQGQGETPDNNNRGEGDAATPPTPPGGPASPAAGSDGEPQVDGTPEPEVAATGELTTVASAEGEPGPGKTTEPDEPAAGDSLSA